MTYQRLSRYEGPATLAGGAQVHCTADLYETAQWDEFVTDLGFVEVGEISQLGWEGALRFRRGQLATVPDGEVRLEFLDGRAGRILVVGWDQHPDFWELDVVGVGPAPWASV